MALSVLSWIDSKGEKFINSDAVVVTVVELVHPSPVPTMYRVQQHDRSMYVHLVYIILLPRIKVRVLSRLVLANVCPHGSVTSNPISKFKVVVLEPKLPIRKSKEITLIRK